MFRLWAKLFKENRMLRDMVVCDDDKELNRTRKIYKALDEVCYEFDLSKPIWLDATIKDFKKSINEFKTHITNKLLNQNQTNLKNTIKNIEINQDTKTHLFKKINILSNLLNKDYEINCSSNNLKPAIFKVINIA